jgi:hypothetical protein
MTQGATHSIEEPPDVGVFVDKGQGPPSFEDFTFFILDLSKSGAAQI